MLHHSAACLRSRAIPGSRAVLHALRLVYKSVLAEQPYSAKQSKVCKLWLCTDHSRSTGARVAAYELKKPLKRARELAASKALACSRFCASLPRTAAPNRATPRN